MAVMLSANQQHPIVLPPEGHLARLVIIDAHCSMLHASADRTHFELRSTFWILRGTQTVGRVLRGCQECKRRKSKPMQPRMAPLPPARVTAYKPVFHSTGIDYLGPLYVTVKRSTEKRWVCLFTCLSTRAIHLELATDLSAPAFLNAFSIFESLRGRPSYVYSDNGTNLVAGERELREGLESLMQDPRFVQELIEKGVSWRFNPPAAPHFGGSWERLVRSTKEALRVILGERTVKEDILRAALAGAASFINGRPLTRLGVDATNRRPLTPNHFLLGRESRSTPPGVFEEAIGATDRNRWVAAQQLIDMLWKRWLLEYLPNQIERQKWTRLSRNVAVSDTVLIVDLQSPRGQWATGVVSKVFRGVDDVVRSVLVKVGGRELKRPVTGLCLLSDREDWDVPEEAAI